MSPCGVRMWDEVKSFDEVMSALSGSFFQQSVLREACKALILQKQLEDYKIPATLDEDKGKALLTAFCQVQKILSEQALVEWFRRNKTTPEALVQSLFHAERLEQLKTLIISEQDVTDAFLKRKSRLDAIVFGLIRVPTEPVARELYHRIQDDGQDFAMLARKFSVGPEAPFGGLIGPKPIHELNPELRAALLALGPEELTEPFTIDGKVYLLARLVRKDPAVLTPELAMTIRNDLFEQWCERQLAMAGIRLVPDVLAEAEGSRSSEVKLP